MKTGFVVFVAQALLVSSVAFGGQSTIEQEVPSFFSPGTLTSLSISPGVGLTLPESYEEYAALVVEAYTGQAQVSTPVESASDKFCERYPRTRQCMHGRYFRRSPERKSVYGNESALYRNLRFVRSDMTYNPDVYNTLYRYNEIYPAFDVAILFSTNSTEQSALVAKLRDKLSNTSQAIGLVYANVRVRDAKPAYGRYVSADDIRFVDETCGFFGTTEEFLSDYACNQ